MTIAFIHGFVLALGLILPLGVQNVFVFNQGVLHTRFTRVLPAILTAAICDTCLILLAVLGVSVVVFAISWVKIIFLLIGIIFLLYMGWATWKATPVHSEDESKQIFTPRKQVAFAASVSLLNPHAIMDTIGVIGTSSLQYDGLEKFGFTVSTIIVSWIWFFGLAWLGRWMGQWDSSGRFSRILNKVSAVIIWGTSIYLATTFWE
jgi:L-lysine exporter family protein LysE/ArgO